MSRTFWVWLHRWVGLAMTLFLVIVGLTGSVLAFQEELDLWLNPELLAAPAHQGETPLDPILLREKAATLHPEARANSVSLTVKPGSSLEFTLTPKGEAEASNPVQLFIDPFTGDKLGERVWGRVSLARQNLIPFLYRLHYSLALPANTGSLGAYILGVVALLWTIDCFVSFYLTLPLRRREAGGRKSWWGRWKPAWLIKWSGGAYRINFDIHRAFGLWTWAMIFVFAWSSVGFNLGEVFKPTMTALFGLTETVTEHAGHAQPVDAPKLDWPAARDRGHVLIDQLAAEHGFKILQEDELSFDRAQGVYTLYAKSSIDPGSDSRHFRRRQWRAPASRMAGPSLGANWRRDLALAVHAAYGRRLWPADADLRLRHGVRNLRAFNHRRLHLVEEKARKEEFRQAVDGRCISANVPLRARRGGVGSWTLGQSTMVDMILNLRGTVKSELPETASAGRISPAQFAKETLSSICANRARMVDALATEGVVRLRHFGSFHVRSKAARPGRNPRTGVFARVSPRRVVSFHASPRLKAAVAECSEESKHCE